MPEAHPSRQSRNLIASKMRKARRERVPSLTQDQLSAKLSLKGVSLDRAAIAKIETGIRGVYDFELVAIADVLAVDIDWLLNREPARGARRRKT